MGFPIKRKKKKRQQLKPEPAPEEYDPQQPEFPIPEEPEEEKPMEEENTYLTQMINEKKGKLNEERTNINDLRKKMEQHVKEVEALQFIKTGDPTIAIADLLEIINDYKKTDGEKRAEHVLTDIERSLIKSTIDGM